MKNLTKGRCESCRGEIEFVQGTKKVKCTHCGTRFFTEAQIENFTTKDSYKDVLPKPVPMVAAVKVRNTKWVKPTLFTSGAVLLVTTFLLLWFLMLPAVLVPKDLKMENRLLTWSEASAARSYSIYAGTTKIHETTGTHFIVPKRFADREISIIAQNFSGTSRKVVVTNKTTRALVVQNLNITSDSIVGVADTTDMLIITGELGTTYTNVQIRVDERITPLIVELIDVAAVGQRGANGTTGVAGGDGASVIQYLGSGRIPELTIISSGSGQNSLTGGAGGTGGTGNSQSTGRPAGHGGTAISAENLYFEGEGTLVLRGGNGGVGGRGGAVGGGLNISATNGGRGGNGGNGIDAANINMNIEGKVVGLLGTGGSGGALWRGSSGLGIGGSNGTAGSHGIAIPSNVTPHTLNGTLTNAL
ncbi:MAG: zinc-ribbon domain-containing protein [Firmicutes bacterium]|nr:zinc-ribbon domain-containing protein [Bacillota bacterium]